MKKSRHLPKAFGLWVAAAAAVLLAFTAAQGKDMTVDSGIKTVVRIGSNPSPSEVLINGVTALSADDLVNYVIDPGFEYGNAFTEEGLEGWNGWIDLAFLDEYYPRTGTYAGGLVADPADWSTGFGQWVTGLQPGTEYIMTAFGRLSEYNPSDPNQWGLYIGVQNFGRDKVQAQIFNPDYIPVILRFVMGDTNTVADVWAWKGPGAEATADDFGVWDFHNFLENGDFEKGSMSDWNAMTDPATADNVEKANGEWCGALPDGKAGFGQVAGHLTPNTTYGLKVSAKVANEGDLAFVTIADFGGEPITYKVRNTGYADTTMAFTTGAADTTALVTFSKDQGGKAYADDFLLCLMVESAGGDAVRDREAAGAPESFGLEQNFPNPFNPETKIAYGMPKAGRVEIAVFDMRGRKVNVLMDSFRPAGSHEIRWDGKDGSGNAVPSGIYFCKMRVSGNGSEYAATRKMVLMK